MPQGIKYSTNLQEQAIDLHFNHGIGFTEISKRLNVPKGSISSWLSYERKIRKTTSARENTNTLSASLPIEPIKQPVGPANVNADPSDIEPSSRDRERALRLLRKQMRSKTPIAQHKIDAAKAILARLAKPKQEVANPDAWKSQYEGMTDNEIAERIVTIGASMLGIDTLQVVFDRLKNNGQADVVGVEKNTTI